MKYYLSSHDLGEINLSGDGPSVDCAVDKASHSLEFARIKRS
jgi:hypothetical protein